ncbi:MAG: UDP-N-acetylmuramoyl-L-alanyl-D-glutamate--2,6-diaminopimelate ligase [Chitinivibrionales bacterium]|nr:UDP-N-acetylmuramoyl-L-alanyl-D-glutamate--2,6-diaminopimelate ligase [Chitinivibrionales bacterium]MBD3355708.1 UDP-N-acetylmuramoyl-L-alanyl-D-glutamate--2,6-diaminopimelate ligase [Chitinivibrionales bacterium]
MRWSTLIKSTTPIQSGGEGDPMILGVTRDSRCIRPGWVYVSVPGLKNHGDAFIEAAVAAGAAAVVSETPQPSCTVPWIRVANPRAAVGPLSRDVNGIDLADKCLAAVTGTNGKTTVTHLFQNLFAHIYGTDRSWMFGTVAYVCGADIKQAPTTTPEAADIFLTMANASLPPRAVSMEVSSHALALDRVAGLKFDVAVFTNLTRDHLDFHADMEDYFLTKKRLFTDYLKPDGKAVINLDDPRGRRLADELTTKNTVTFGKASDATFRIIDSHASWDGVSIEVAYEGRLQHFETGLAGTFNIQNVAAAAAGALALGISSEDVGRSLAQMKTVPGRMERVETKGEFAVVVDYAHTPDALVNVLTAARPLTKGRLLCVFGCGGDRDARKRPLMAEAVARHCDEAIVTSDNPRSEKPQAIIDDILPGIPLDFPHHVIVDRAVAIRKALSLAGAGDCVVIAGKGHETYQDIGGVRHHFDDREVAMNLTAEILRGRTDD